MKQHTTLRKVVAKQKFIVPRLHYYRITVLAVLLNSEQDPNVSIGTVTSPMTRSNVTATTKVVKN